MAKSQQTFNKNEKEKKRLKKREDKRKKMEARKAEAKESGKKGIEFAYMDAYGNFTDTPPDPAQKIIVNAEDIHVSVPKTLESEREVFDPVRNGTVSKPVYIEKNMFSPHLICSSKEEYKFNLTT